METAPLQVLSQNRWLLKQAYPPSPSPPPLNELLPPLVSLHHHGGTSKSFAISFVAALVTMIAFLLFRSVLDCLSRWALQQAPACTLPRRRKAVDLSFVPTRVVQLGSCVGCVPAGDDCVICLGGFLEGETIRVLPACRHLFHKECLDSWLLLSSSASPLTCPICRAPVADGGGEQV